MTRDRFRILGLLVVLVGVTCWLGCQRPETNEQTEAQKHRPVRQAIDNTITITVTNVNGSNVCTQDNRIIGPIGSNDTVTYQGVDPVTGNGVPVKVYFPDPGFAAARQTFPGSPFVMNLAGYQYQYAVTGGTKSNPANLTGAEGNFYMFFYTGIDANGTPCGINHQGMGISVQK